MVWLHGGFLDRRMWEPQFARFATRYDLVRFDQRGYGRSDPASTEYTESFDLKELLDRLSIPSAYLVGLAMGARIALDLAVLFPERAHGLALVAPTLDGYQPADPAERALWEALDRRADEIESIYRTEGPDRAIEAKLDDWGPGLPPERREMVRAIALENQARALAGPGALRRSLVPPAIERLGAVRCPALVVTGERDFPGFEGVARVLGERLPIVQHSVLAGADHLANLSEPEAFNELLEGFFARLDFIAMQRGGPW